MIAVIADDFTGAAEIGGAGLRRGLKIVIETVVRNEENADLLIIATNTRSESPEFSVQETARVTGQLMKFNPAFIYKKLDSVLRGNVAEELITQMEVSGKRRAVVVAGNPHFGRIIKDGICYINGVPVDDTSFSKDPDFRVQSSKVTELVCSDRSVIYSLSSDQPVPDRGIIIGDVVNGTEMVKWAEKVDSDTVAAGGAGFFTAMLNKICPLQEPENGSAYHLGKKVLSVFGSAYPKNPDEISLLKESGFVFSTMPERLYLEENAEDTLLSSWTEGIIRDLEGNGKVILAVGPADETEEGLPARISENMGIAVKKVFDRVEADDLLIEGGATAFVILKKLEITKMVPVREIEYGVIQLMTDKYPGLSITTKPGSYPWPSGLISANGSERKMINNY